MSKIAAQRH